MPLARVDLGDFDAELYLKLLHAVADADGVHPVEEDYIRHQAAALHVDPEVVLGKGPIALEQLQLTASEVTRRMVYRDCYTLACADGAVSDQERATLHRLRRVLNLTPERATALEAWVARYSAMIEEGQALLTQPEPQGVGDPARAVE